MKDKKSLGSRLASLRWSKSSKEQVKAHMAMMNKARLLKLKQKKDVKKYTSN